MAIAEPPGKAGGERPVRAIVADDSVLLREGIVRLLESGGFEVVAQAGDADDLLRKVRAHKPDVAIVDVRMPPTFTDEGLRAALQARRQVPALPVLVSIFMIASPFRNQLVIVCGGSPPRLPRRSNSHAFAPAARSRSSALRTSLVTSYVPVLRNSRNVMYPTPPGRSFAVRPVSSVPGTTVVPSLGARADVPVVTSGRERWILPPLSR